MNKYDDMINLEYPFVSKHPRMSIYSRAAQFAPFAALSGYGEAIREEARVTYDKLSLDDDLSDEINRKIQIISDNIKNKPVACFKCYVSDKYKDGGNYVLVKGMVKKIDKYRGVIILDNDEVIIDNIIDISSDMFGEL